MLSLKFQCRFPLTQALQLIGGATKSIFVKTETLLLENSNYQQALDFIAQENDENINQYKSVMDFLFCEIYPEWQVSCHHYYEGTGPKLKDILTPKQIIRYDECLLKALKIAHKLFCEQHQESYEWYIKKIKVGVGH